MNHHTRKQYNSNPWLSTPIPLSSEAPQEHLSHSAPAKMPSLLSRKRSTYDVDLSDMVVEQAHSSPTSAMEVNELGSRASPVEQLGREHCPKLPATSEPARREVLSQLCFAMPTRSGSSRVLLASAANMARDVYVHLVKLCVFSGTDILSNYGALDCPSLDPMGVLFSVQTILRLALTQELLSHHNLDLQIRELVATVLMLVYKVRSESYFRHRYVSDHSVGTIVMSQFMQSSELPLRNLDAVRSHMMHLEVEMLNKLPLLSLIDDNPHTGMEWAVHRHCEAIVDQYKARYTFELAKGELDAVCGLRDLEAACHDEKMLALSASYFFYHAACLNTDEEMLETMGLWCTATEMGEALAYLGFRGITLLPASERPAPTCSKTVLVAAAHFARNAQRLSAQRTAGLCVYAAANETHPVMQIVGARGLARLLTALKSYL